MKSISTVIPNKFTQSHRALRWGTLTVLLVAGITIGSQVWASHRKRLAVRSAAAGGRWAEARMRLEGWLAAEPDSAEAHYFRARVALGQDRPAEVAAGLDRARTLGHPETDLALLRAIAAARQGRPDSAEPVLRRAFDSARAPDPLLDEALARVYIEAFDFARALPALERWAREAPRDPKPYLWRAEIDRRTSDDPAALIHDYREALRRDPERSEARLGLADALHFAHRCAEAEPEYAAYLVRKPDDPAGHFGAGRNALELGDEADAIRQFERALELDPGHAQALRERAEIALRHGENGQALALLDRAFPLEPDEIKVRYARALALTRLGRSDEAKTEQAVVARLRQDETLLDQLRRRLVQTPEDLTLQRQAARWMFGHGHAAEGVRWAEKALRDHPGDPETCRLLAEHHQRAGNPGLANYYRAQSSPEPDPAGPLPGP